MSILTYTWGCLSLAVSLGLVGVAAATVTTRWFPYWDRPTRVLAGVALVLGWLFAVSYSLGTVGWFRPLPMYLAVNAGAVATLVTAGKLRRGWPQAHRVRRDEDPQPDADAGSQPSDERQWWRDGALLVAITGTVIAVATWLPPIAHSYRYGILEPDSTWYHGHTVGRFLQTGWLTRINPVGTDAMVPFHPMNSEVIDALLIMPWHRDLVIPLVTLAGLGLLLLAGWCIGGFWNRAPAGLIAMALMASPATIRISQPGSLKNDLLGAAFLTSGVALALHARRRLPAIALSGVMLGLAVGTRTNLLLPAAVIVATGVGVLLLGHLRDRRAAKMPERPTAGAQDDPAEPRRPDQEPARWLVAITWVGALGLFGSFWYLRNWVRVGSPLPWSDINLGPLRLEHAGSVDERYFETTIFHWRDHPDLISSAIRPGLRLAFGDLWWGWGVLGVAAVALVAFRVITNVRSIWSGDETGRQTLWLGGVAAAGCLGALSHATTPLSLVVAPDNPIAPTNIAINTRYAVPAFGLLLLAGVGAMTHRWMELAFSVVTLALIIQAAFPTLLYPDASNDAEAGDGPLAVVLAIALAALVLGTTVLWPHLAQQPRLPLIVGSTALLALVIALAQPALDSYLDRRYATLAPVHGGDLWPATKELSDARIGMAATAVPYPYLGDDFSNKVSYIGVAGMDGLLRDAHTCSEWVHKLDDGRFTHVALTQNPLSGFSPQTARDWTLSIPGARVIHEQQDATLIELPTNVEPTCGDQTDDA